MNTKKSPMTMSAGNSLNLKQLVQTAIKVLPTKAEILRPLLDKDDVIHQPFSGFVLDSRQLTNDDRSTSKDNQKIKPVFVLLKSQTQSIEKSRIYADAARKEAAFILSEINPEDLGYDENDKSQCSEAQCQMIYVPKIRETLGTLIQLSLLPPSSLNNVIDAASVTATLPQVVAVTGTNGKTTISQLIAQLCYYSDDANLHNSAVMGTAGNGRLDALQQSTHTTGDALAVQTFLRELGDDNIDVLALEASSHGLDQHRLQGVPVKVAVYSNLSRDHLDYHKDMDDYAHVKARLFDTSYFPELTHAIINLDDEFASTMMEAAVASGIDVWTYSLKPDSSATFVATQVKPSLEGVEIHLVTNFGTVTLNSPLLGHFNVANLIAAIAAVMALGISLDDMPKMVAKLQGASGRMQRVTAELPDDQSSQSDNQGVFIVDYAHTPDALTQVLSSLKPHCEGDLWAVYGCGGDRDRGKRPLMAQAGLSIADKVILTSDNPRSEDPEQILQDMQQGMTDAQYSKTTVINDRKDAIEYAVEHAGHEDIVVIAGKGHETYQEINGVRYDFDDREVLKKRLQQSQH